MAAALIRGRISLLSVQTPGASTSQCRAFHASVPALAGKNGGAKPGKKVQAGKKAQKIGSIKGKPKKEDKGPRRVEAHSIVKLDHPLFRTPATNITIPPFDPADLTQASVGLPKKFSTVDRSVISTFGLPKTLKQEFLHVAHPFSIIRESTLSTLDTLDKLGADDPQERLSANRLVLTGPSGCGKSVLLLQAANYCALNEWIVFYVPRGIDWVNATSPFSFDYRSQLFAQHALAAEALHNILHVNHARISKLHLEEEVPLPGGKPGATVKAGTSLEALAQYGIKDPLLAPQTLVLLFEALGKQTKYPFLLAIDDFQAMYNTTAYRDPQFKPLNSYHMSMPRLILEYASGRRELRRGGLLGALSQTSTEYTLINPLREALDVEYPGGRTATPYDRQRTSYRDFTEGLKPLPVPSGFSTAEASAFLDTWQKMKAFHSNLNDSFFLSKYTETNGNPRELFRNGIMGTMQL